MGGTQRFATKNLVLLLSLSIARGCLSAQGSKPTEAASPSLLGIRPEVPQDTVQQTSAWRSIGFGLLGGAVGLVGGAIVGYQATGGSDFCGDDRCGIAGGFFGGLAVEALGLSLGVHLGNERQGNYWVDLLATAGVAAVGIGAMVWIDPDEGGLLALAATPVLQLSVAVPLERRTGRSRSR